DGSGKSYGGYATYARHPGNFVFKIPDGLDSAEAAPMLCGGVTVYSPLKNYGCGPGKKVGIVGVGGLGHFGVLFAKALGADEVVGISRKATKKDEVLKLGADRYIATDDDKDWAQNNRRTLDLIISTVSSGKMPLDGYVSLLKTRGTLIQVGAPDAGELPNINAFTLIMNGIKVGGSAIGPPDEINEMLKLAADQKIHPWIEKRPMKDANKAIVDMDAGKARYRYVLCNDE
ncbi:putative zinc-binding alcohol dehydrogenase, partial [Aureobasidium melanogenum]